MIPKAESTITSYKSIKISDQIMISHSDSSKLYIGISRYRQRIDMSFETNLRF